ncbi:MAG: hypothetical protein P4L99_26360 [Chthoniobacter sp.]|nr:hypothetical protein [Chthoniobacter sp.]
MKSLFTAPVQWSEQAVGSRPRFFLTVAMQLAGVLFVCWLSEWQYLWPMMFIGLFMPLYYLIALRGVMRELQGKGEKQESSGA